MSYRTLLEINHDFADHLSCPEFAQALKSYLTSACDRTARNLEPFGIRVVGMRHHSGKFILDGEPDGFPVQYLPKDPS